MAADVITPVRRGKKSPARKNFHSHPTATLPSEGRASNQRESHRIISQTLGSDRQMPSRPVHTRQERR